VLLAELVAAADAVAATSSRTAKVAILADALRRAGPADALIAVSFLAGAPRQGRIGVGWATVVRTEVPPAAHPTLSLAEVDAALGRMLRTSGAGSARARAALLANLLGRATVPEADFLRRLLVGELRQGALEGVVAEAVAAAAGAPAEAVRRAWMLSGDLGRAASLALAGGVGALAAVRLEPLHPVEPMLAATAADVAHALARTGPASVEWKLDGVRIQAHRHGDRVAVYTRNLNDVTERMPEVVEVVRSLAEPRLVLDGEALALDADARPRLFQETMGRVGRRADDGALPLAPWFFDCLHAGGEDLLDRPLAERLDALDRVAAPWRVPAVRTADPAEAARMLEAALAAGHEGVMVKALDAPYRAGRRGRAWLKVKRAQSLDLAVLAAEWGHGRRRGWLSNLHLGARDPVGGFVMVGKTFKGLTDETLRWQTERLLALATAREGIVVRVRPELVVEIELDGVQASPRYPGGVALRFARVLRYRPDKRPAEADTIDAVRALLPRATPA
jgi:DNA ligase-1